MHRIRPLRDWVALRPIAYEHDFLTVIGIPLRQGEVVAVGPGRRMRRKLPYRKNPDRADEVTWFEDGAETGQRRPLRVKVGDVVDFGWRSAREFRLGGELLLMVPEQSLYWHSERRGQGLLEPESM